jgi:hypothetical protein
VFPLALLALGAMPVELSLLALFTAVYGAVNGIMTIVRGMAVPEMLTREAYGAVNGVMTAPSAVVRALAPAGAALLWSVGGSYDTVLWAIVAGAVVTMLCFWLAALFSARIRP